jgi:hypothetical protein
MTDDAHAIRNVRRRLVNLLFARGVIDHQDFEVAIGLVENALDRPRGKGAAVKAGNDDGDFHPTVAPYQRAALFPKVFRVGLTRKRFAQDRTAWLT